MGAVRHTPNRRSDRPGRRLGGGYLCLWFGMLALLVVSIGAIAHPLPAGGAMPMAFDDGTEQSSVPDHGDCAGGDGHLHMSLSRMSLSRTCSVASCGSLAAVLPLVKTIRPVSSVPLLPAPEQERAGIDSDPIFHPPKPSSPA